MSTDLARLDLLLHRRGTIGYALGMAVYMFVVVALYPAFKNDVSSPRASQRSRRYTSHSGTYRLHPHSQLVP
jgi:hypothetical protein